MARVRLKANAASEDSRSLAFACGEASIEIGREIVRLFDGDLAAYFVFVAIANASQAEVMTDPDLAPAFSDLRTPMGERMHSIKLLPLAEITGLPRTTVRRKVKALEGMGLVQGDRSGYSATPEAGPGNPVIAALLPAMQRCVSRLLAELDEYRLLQISGEPD